MLRYYALRRFKRVLFGVIRNLFYELFRAQRVRGRFRQFAMMMKGHMPCRPPQTLKAFVLRLCFFDGPVFVLVLVIRIETSALYFLVAALVTSRLLNFLLDKLMVQYLNQDIDEGVDF